MASPVVHCPACAIEYSPEFLRGDPPTCLSCGGPGRPGPPPASAPAAAPAAQGRRASRAGSDPLRSRPARLTRGALAVVATPPALVLVLALGWAATRDEPADPGSAGGPSATTPATEAPGTRSTPRETAVDRSASRAPEPDPAARDVATALQSMAAPPLGPDALASIATGWRDAGGGDVRLLVAGRTRHPGGTPLRIALYHEGTLCDAGATEVDREGRYAVALGPYAAGDSTRGARRLPAGRYRLAVQLRPGLDTSRLARLEAEGLPGRGTIATADLAVPSDTDVPARESAEARRGAAELREILGLLAGARAALAPGRDPAGAARDVERSIGRLLDRRERYVRDPLPGPAEDLHRLAAALAEALEGVAAGAPASRTESERERAALLETRVARALDELDGPR